MKLTDECINNNSCHLTTSEFHISFCAHHKFVFNVGDSLMCVCVYLERIHPHSQFALLRVFITSNIYTSVEQPFGLQGPVGEHLERGQSTSVCCSPMFGENFYCLEFWPLLFKGALIRLLYGVVPECFKKKLSAFRDCGVCKRYQDE